MITSLGRTTLLVRDYEEAAAFYCGVLGFATLHDSTAPDGQRFLHIAVPAQGGTPPVGLWLLRAASADAALIGRQAGGQPFLILYTDDCRRTTATLEARGVRFRTPPVADGGAVFAHFADLYGNELLLVQLAES